jgi:hypothetical protein
MIYLRAAFVRDVCDLVGGDIDRIIRDLLHLVSGDVV